MRDTDSNKSSDFLLNPVCIMLIYMYIITAFMYCTNEIKFKLKHIIGVMEWPPKRGYMYSLLSITCEHLHVQLGEMYTILHIFGQVSYFVHYPKTCA